MGNIEYEAKLNEAKIRNIRSQRTLQEIENPAPRKTQTAAEALIAEEIENIDGVLEAKFAKRRKISELKKDERFRKMSREGTGCDPGTDRGLAGPRGNPCPSRDEAKLKERSIMDTRLTPKGL